MKWLIDADLGASYTLIVDRTGRAYTSAVFVVLIFILSGTSAIASVDLLAVPSSRECRNASAITHGFTNPILSSMKSSETPVPKTPTLTRNRIRVENSRRAARTKAYAQVESLDGRVLLSGGMHPEHMAALKLVPHADASHVAVSGNWSEIWGSDRPGDGAEVLIPEGITVTVDDQFAAELEWIRVDGTLQFATDEDTALRVETIVVSPHGRLQIGTAADPIDADVSANITFVDQGPIDRIEDPLGIGRGLVDLSGHLSIYGAKTTGFVDLAKYPMAGDTTLHLSEVPSNWEVGGHIVLPGTNPGPRSIYHPVGNQDEELRITSIQGTTVTLDRALRFDHRLPDDIPLPLAYLDRNVVLSSENTAVPSRRGHVMIMPGGHEHVHLPGDPMGSVVAYAQFDGLGRTHVDVPVTDPQLDKNGQLIPGTSGNDRGRYSLHFHRMGVDNPSRPSTVRGVSVTHGLKWGVVNHGSNVVVEDSVAYVVQGAGFATEAGNEIGAFRHNLALRSTGHGGKRSHGTGLTDYHLLRNPLPGGQDLGFTGHGFWLQGGGTPVIDNVAMGHAHDAFAIFTMPILPSIEFPVANLTPDLQKVLAPNPRYPRLPDRTHIPVSQVPFTFAGNQGLASGSGLGVYVHDAGGGLPGVYSHITGSTFARVGGSGIFAFGSRNMVVEDVRAIHDTTTMPSGFAFQFYGGAGNFTWNNFTAIGFPRGIQMPQQGDNTVNGGHFDNGIDIFIGNYGTGTVTLNLETSSFPAPGPMAVKAAKHNGLIDPVNVLMDSNFVRGWDINRAFSRVDRDVTLNQNGVTNYLYFPESARDYRLGNLSHVFPASMADMTNGELWDRYRLAINGVVAPSDARGMPGIIGLVSETSPPVAPPDLSLWSPRITDQLSGYTLQVKDANRQVIDLATADLKPDQWNFVSGDFQGQTVAFAIYAKTAPAEFHLTDSSLRPKDATIRRSLLTTGLTIYGRIYDTVADFTFPSGTYQRSFRPDELIVDSDGKVRVWIEFEDMIGRKQRQQLVLTIVD